jgi:hypothetical protein
VIWKGLIIPGYERRREKCINFRELNDLASVLKCDVITSSELRGGKELEEQYE